jgi:hypothetical protein
VLGAAIARKGDEVRRQAVRCPFNASAGFTRRAGARRFSGLSLSVRLLVREPGQSRKI